MDRDAFTHPVRIDMNEPTTFAQFSANHFSSGGFASAWLRADIHEGRLIERDCLARAISVIAARDLPHLLGRQ